MDVDECEAAEMACLEAEQRLDALRKQRLDVQSAGFFSDVMGLSTIHEPPPTNGLAHDRAELMRQLDEEKAEMDRKFAEMLGKLEEQDRKIAEESKSREEVLAEVESSTALVATSAPRATVLPTVVNTGMTRMVGAAPQGIPVLTDAAAGIWQGVKDFHIRRARNVANFAVRNPVATPYATYGPTRVVQPIPGIGYRGEPYPLYTTPGLPPDVLRQQAMARDVSNNNMHLKRVLTNGEMHANVPLARSIGAAATMSVPGTTTVVRRTIGPSRGAGPKVVQSPTPNGLQAPPTVMQAAPPQAIMQQVPAQSSYYDYIPGPSWIFGS
mmetsp:Transcript_16606/g.30828  ORF Transcript_16606/g.30828 Transcript_16606/m.30828 type:complete len:325 (-) Transcript_16606:31-1005(-)